MPIEAFYRPVPETTTSAREAMRTGYELLPTELITEVVVNDAARDMLPANLKYLASADFIAASTRMTVPVENAQHQTIAPYSFGRTIPMGHGYIPFADTIGTSVIGKGSWICGEELNYVRRRYDLINNHDGLLSADGAKYDTISSNALIESGFRSQLHLGYSVLNTPKLREWIESHWAHLFKMNEVIERSFSQLLEDEDDAAFLLRVGTSTERINDTLSNNDISARLRSETARVARAFLMESSIKGTQMDRLINMQDDPAYSAVLTTALAKLAHRHHITDHEFATYAQLFHNVLDNNSYAFLKANEKLEYPLAGGQLAYAKDIDLGFMACDYDSAISTFDDRDLSNRSNHEMYVYSANNAFRVFLRTFGPILTGNPSIYNKFVEPGPLNRIYLAVSDQFDTSRGTPKLKRTTNTGNLELLTFKQGRNA